MNAHRRAAMPRHARRQASNHCLNGAVCPHEPTARSSPRALPSRPCFPQAQACPAEPCRSYRRPELGRVEEYGASSTSCTRMGIRQAAHGGQDQVWHAVIGREANLRCGPLSNSTGTRSGLLRVRVARILEAQACPPAALAPPRRCCSATCTQQPNGRVVSRASYGHEPRHRWFGPQSAR